MGRPTPPHCAEWNATVDSGDGLVGRQVTLPGLATRFDQQRTRSIASVVCWQITSSVASRSVDRPEHTRDCSASIQSAGNRDSGRSTRETTRARASVTVCPVTWFPWSPDFITPMSVFTSAIGSKAKFNIYYFSLLLALPRMLLYSVLFYPIRSTPDGKTRLLRTSCRQHHSSCGPGPYPGRSATMIPF